MAAAALWPPRLTDKPARCDAPRRLTTRQGGVERQTATAGSSMGGHRIHAIGPWNR